MGAVLHFRVCKGCVVGHGHSHGGNGHSHPANIAPHASADDELLRASARSSNGYQPLPAESDNDVALLNSNADDEDFTVQLTQDTTNVNIRAAMVHVVGDLIQSVGVLTAAIIIRFKVCCRPSLLLLSVFTAKCSFSVVYT